MLKKLLASLMIVVVMVVGFSVYFTPQAKAASSTWFDTNPRDFESWYLKVFDTDSTPATEIFGERYTAAQVQWVFYSLISGTLNGILTREGMTCIMKFKAGDPNLLTCFKGIIGFLDILGVTSDNSQKSNFSVAQFFTSQPISAIGYVIRKTNDFSLIPTAHAQGFGFTTGANMVQSVWKVTRNLAYSFLVIVVIIFAFMIMFRMKVNPQTVVTVQSALPKIVIAIILITFSYAIAGLLIDLMYVAIGILAVVFTSSGMSDGTAVDLFKKFATDNIFGRSIGFVLQMFMATFGNIWKGIDGGTGIAAILGIILVFHVAFKYLGIVIMIFKTYANIIIGIITGPLEILMGTLTQGGFGSWVRKMIANLAVFPLLCFMMYMSYYFIIQASGANVFSFYNIAINSSMYGTNAWQPPYMHPPSITEWFGGVQGGGFLWVIVAYAIFVSIPQAAAIASGIISGKMLNMESAIGEPAGLIGRGVSTGASIIHTGGEYGRVFKALGLAEKLSSKAPSKISPAIEKAASKYGNIEAE